MKTSRCTPIDVSRSIALVLGLVAVPSALAGNGIPPANVSAVRVDVPIPTDDFSKLARPNQTLQQAVTQALLNSGVVPAEQHERGKDGQARFWSYIEKQIPREVASALQHDGYAARIWVRDEEANTLVKVVLAIYPDQNPAFTEAVKAHESGHAASHMRVVETKKQNTINIETPDMPEPRWRTEIERAENDAADNFHAAVGNEIPENIAKLGSGAEDPAVLEQHGREAADKALRSLAPSNPPGPRR